MESPTAKGETKWEGKNKGKSSTRSLTQEGRKCAERSGRLATVKARSLSAALRSIAHPTHDRQTQRERQPRLLAGRRPRAPRPHARKPGARGRRNRLYQPPRDPRKHGLSVARRRRTRRRVPAQSRAPRQNVPAAHRRHHTHRRRQTRRSKTPAPATPRTPPRNHPPTRSPTRTPTTTRSIATKSDPLKDELDGLEAVRLVAT